jgi:hypothetical protein
MAKTTKILLAGVILGLLTLGVGQLATVKNAAHFSDLVAKCEAESTQQAKRAQLDSVQPKPPWEIDDVVCNPDALRRLGVKELQGVQRELVLAEQDLGGPFETASVIAGLVMFLTAIPYSWYFFLRRIREVANAVTGK